MNFITTCTSRKTLPCPAGLSMQSIAANSVQKRFSAWLERLSCDKSETKKPTELYSGGSWKIVRRINSEFSGKLKTWVVSAGQGLLDEEEKVPSYAATFASGEPDCVVSGKVSSDNLTDWWTLLCEWRRANGKVISSLADLAHAYPNQPMVVALSADYFKATQTDLLKARATLADPELLILISAGTKPKGPLAENLVPADARFENLFGKSRLVLNNKIAALVLRDFKPEQMNVQKVSEHLEKMIRELPPSSYPSRTRGTDAEVRRFLEAKASTTANPCYTALLKEYRSLGRACEQRRFRSLFHETSSAQLSNAA